MGSGIMYREKIINIQTGEETFRDYTPEEISEMEKYQEILKQEQIVNEEKNKIRNSALAKLAALGFTEEEIAAL
jgi:hypothetical protein